MMKISHNMFLGSHVNRSLYNVKQKDFSNQIDIKKVMKSIVWGN